MRNITFLIGIIMIIAANQGFGQLMINGGFEEYLQVTNPDYLVDNAPGWHNLNNSCDILHPSNSLASDASHQPRTGNGNGRFASPVNNQQEWLYGTTQPLSVGITYVVSFWIRKDYTTTKNLQVGAFIGPNIPAQQIISPSYIPTNAAQITFTPTSTQYVKASYCYTPAVNGPHYLTIGNFAGNGTGEDQVFLIDDVSITVKNGDQSEANSVLTIANNTVCLNGNVIVDGSQSVNEEKYIWKIVKIEGSGETLIYQSTIFSGNVGTLNVSATFDNINHSPLAGACYRVYLTTMKECANQISIDFCYENPDISFLNDGDPVCLNSPVDLEVTGENGWTYLWKQGSDTLSIGVGQKLLTVTPTTSGTKLYSVTVTTAAGCTYTEYFSLSVQNTTNVAPWFDGINGSGEFTAYVTSGNGIGFSSTLFNDNAGELLTVNENTSGIPFPVTLIRPFQSGEQMQFWWQTTGVPPGTYSFLLITDDHNTCSPGIDTVKFIIIVICDHCPTCIGYENRSAATTPLPPETKVGKCIEAGMYQNVIVGNNPVLFQAGNYILLGNYFDSGSNGSFEAVIDPSTCVSDCQDCCVDWDGFTYDTPPIVTHMNLDDSDPTNDFFYLTDVNHPFCAFNAKGFHLTIYDDDENFIYETEYYGEECCPFESPSPEHPMTHSSIFWDGLRESSTHQQVHAFDGIYYWKVTLYGCNGESIVLNERIHYGLFTGMAQAPGGAMTEQQLQAAEIQRELDKRFEEIGLMPNPASSTVNITGFADNELLSYQLFDERGLMISKKEQLSQHSFDVSRLSDGTYYCRIYKDGQYIVKKFVKI